MYQQLWRSGNLRWLLLPHQQPEYDRLRAWALERNTEEARKRSKELGALYTNMWMTEWSRRTGKSAFWLVIMLEEAIRYFNRTREGYQGMLCTVAKDYIGDIFVPLAQKLFNPELTGCPEGYEPVYRGTKDGLHEGFHIPAVRGYIKLVGLDKNPDATRGKWLDGCVITEAAFVGDRQLVESVTTIQPQFSGRPWGFIALESSTAREPDHPFNSVFREDCRLRDCYSMKTIEDNTSLTPEEIEQELDRVGGRMSPAARREYFCEAAKDVDALIVPEFDESIHVVSPVDYPRPAHAHAYVGMDPGVADACGLVWFYVDFLRQVIVVEAAWAKRNQATSEIAREIRRVEQALWGAQHRMHRPLLRQPTLLDCMRPTLPADLVEPTTETNILGAIPKRSGQVWEAPRGSLTYWDATAATLRPNPVQRISDTQAQAILDLRHDHGLEFTPAAKGPGSKEANLQHFRMLFLNRKIVILKNGLTEPLIQQLRSGVWNDKRTAWKSTPTLFHCDALASCMYGSRAVNWHRNPFPPDVKDPNAPDVWIPAPIRKVLDPTPAPQRFPTSGRPRWR